jgi:hypothetical protein
MGRLTWGLVFVALVSCACAAVAHGQAYTYFETFDNDTDAFTPATNYGDSAAGGQPPAGWHDHRTEYSPSWPLIEEVPSGFDGVATGPHGGNNMAMVFGAVQWHVPERTKFPLGSVSMQFDFLYDPARAKTGQFHGLVTEWATYEYPPSSLSGLRYTDLWVYNVHPSTLVPVNRTYRVSNDSGFQPIVTLSTTPTWYTAEILFEAASESDPTTGQPLLSEVINLYKQAGLEAGFRRGELVGTIRTIFSTVAPTHIAPAVLLLGTQARPGDFHYVDNVALGPPINTPEPGGAAIVLAGILTATGARRRPSSMR